LQQQLEPMQTTSTKKRKNPHNTLEDMTLMEPQIHDVKTMLEEIRMEKSYLVSLEDLDELEVEEKTLSKILE